MSDIVWKLDESNEVTFKVDVSSSERIQSAPKVRLVCESNDLHYAFPGSFIGGDEVKVNIPPMNGKISEGEYNAKLEVIVEDKYFVPLSFDAKFEITTKVVAEIVAHKEGLKTNNIQKEKKPKTQIKESENFVKASFVESKNTKHKPKTTYKIKSLKERFGQ